MIFRTKVLPRIVIGLMVLFLVACGAQTAQRATAQTDAQIEAPQAVGGEHSEAEQEHDEAAEEHREDDHEHNERGEHGPAAETLAIADMTPIDLAAGEKLKVLATTNIIGDLAGNVAGDLIDLTVMVPLGSDPHTFSPTPQDVAAVAEADVVLSNGLGFEEFLGEMIDNAGGEAAVISTATGVETRKFAADTEHEEGEDEHNEASEDEHHHEGADPHTWLIPTNVAIMVHNIAQALSALDPANAEAYIANAEAYEIELEALDAWIEAQIETIPAKNREMVTDHDAFGYYADRYGLEIIGAVIPAYSTNASPSAQELATLQDAIGQFEAKAVFVGITVNPVLAQQVATDTGIQLVSLYTGSLGEAGSGADTYIDYMRYNTTAIVEALR